MPALPNRKNIKKLPPAKAAKAQAAIKNFLPAMPWPPTTFNAQAQMKAAVDKYKLEVNKTQQAAAKTVGNGFPPPPAVQLAAQETNVGNQLPGIAKFLPAGTDLQSTTFSQAIATLDDSIAALEAFAANPTALGAQSARDASLNEFYRNK